MSFDDLAQSVSALFNHFAVRPLAHFFLGLSKGDRTVLYVLLAAALASGFLIGRRRTFRSRHATTFQNSGEARVSRVLLSEFGAPDYHLMNHVTIQMDDGTTEIDHILISRFGVFVIETKDYKGWIFANATHETWTQVLFRLRFKVQNPIFQNKRHVRAVQDLLEFLPLEAIRSVIVFTGEAEFKTEIPQGMVTISGLVGYLRAQTEEIMSLNRVQFCVGRLETARLAISRVTDVEHMRSLERRRGGTLDERSNSSPRRW
jgi:Nuclease-related domain